MSRYMLDTNAVSDLVKGHPDIARRLVAVPMSSICISAITEGELLYGLAKRPQFSRLRVAVEEFLRRTDVLPWDSSVTPSHGHLHASLEGQGKVLQALDLQIAAHALSVEAVLVTADKAFSMVSGLSVEDWKQAQPSL
jgi:tRNA(fMet)-specific endonuclease VapC